MSILKVSSAWFKHVGQHLLHSMWKKKTLVLAVIIVSTLVFVGLQYNLVAGEKKLGDKSDGTDRIAERNRYPSIPRRNLSAMSNADAQMSVRRADGKGEPFSFNANRGNTLVSVRDERGQAHQQLMQQQREASSSHHYEKQQQQVLFHDSDRSVRFGDKSADATNDNAFETNKAHYIPELRVVHFDLKGAPPKISYFKQIFPLLKEAGANAILLEYEDMFPYWDVLKPAVSFNPYSRNDLRVLRDLAKMHNFEVIPLVQTFGHLEFVLKLQDFRNLREVDDYPMAICPSKNESFKLVTTMIDQVMIMHPSAKWLHIGCDEVFHLGYCDKCRQQERDNLFINHVARVAKYVREKYNVIPIVWDDMLRQIAPEKMKDARLGKLVEPMVWTYVRDVYRFIPYSTWMSFAEIFPNIWAASAFKGAFGETLTVPNIKMHLENNEAWLEVMAEQKKNFRSMRGIVITGWQRYDHLGTLCELLPAGLPSLVINLITANQGYYDQGLVFKKFDKIMQCSSRNYYSSQNDVDLETDTNLWQRASNCFFPGSAVFRMTQHVADAVKRVNDYLYDVTIHKAWMTDFNVRHNISNPFRVDEGLQDYSSVYYTLTSAVRTAKEALQEVFDDATVSEWIEQNIYPYLIKMEKLMKDAVELKKAKTWPKRPIKPLDDLRRFGVTPDNHQNNNNAKK